MASTQSWSSKNVSRYWDTAEPGCLLLLLLLLLRLRLRLLLLLLLRRLILLLLLQVLLYPASDLVDYGLKCRLKQKVLKLMVFRLGSYLGVTGVWLQVWAKPRNQTPTTLR